MRLMFYIDRSWLLRIFGSLRGGEIAYAKLGWDLGAHIEFPSDWHEYRRAWVVISPVFFTIAFSFPWKWTVPDQGQCSGPKFGFSFFGDALWLYFGKSSGRSDDPARYIAWYLPWSWEHIRHDYLNPDGSLHHRALPSEYSPPEETKRSYPYSYWRRSGEVQRRTATINGEEREWRWKWFTWLPWPSKIIRTINVEFSDEVGEGTGSWKGGVLGTSHEWKQGEVMEMALIRMERERKFSR